MDRKNTYLISYYFKTRPFLQSIYLFLCSPDTFMAAVLNVLLLKLALTEKQDMRAPGQ